jgi:hypothetical protein
MKSERGQGQMILVAIVALIAIAFLLAGMAANQHGMHAGANTIGNAVGEAIDDAQDQEWRNIDWQILNGTVVSFWVNQQRIHPNKHAIDSHDTEAIVATNCYNDHGTFMVLANRSDDWYFPCLEEDGKTVRLTIWKREGNIFHLKSAYTKGDGAWSWNQLREFLQTKWGATKATFPSDGVLYIDNAPAPFIGQ